MAGATVARDMSCFERIANTRSRDSRSLFSIVCEVSGTGLSILVAVELDDRTQRMLDAAEFGTALELEEAREQPRLELSDVGAPSEVAAAVH